MADSSDAASKAGFVYILSNPAMPGLVKIGLTKGEVAARKSELSRPTSVPLDFEIVYDELVSDCQIVESHLHYRFAAQRVNKRREFFRIPVREAIAALQEEAGAYPIAPLAEQRQDILPWLEHRFRRWLRADLVGAFIVQVGDVVYLESVVQPSVQVNDRDIHRGDLGFIYDDIDDDEPMFSASKSIDENARLFVELDTYTIHYLTDLFNSEANDYIEHLHKLQERIPFAPPA